MHLDKTASVCKVLIGVLGSGADKLTGSKSGSGEFAKAICAEAFKDNL